jgi:hypothetical protein
MIGLTGNRRQGTRVAASRSDCAPKRLRRQPWERCRKQNQKGEVQEKSEPWGGIKANSQMLHAENTLPG